MLRAEHTVTLIRCRILYYAQPEAFESAVCDYLKYHVNYCRNNYRGKKSEIRTAQCLLAMLMLYTVTVLITVCCGSKFESIAYTILVNGLLPMTVMCVTFSVFDKKNNLRKISALHLGAKTASCPPQICCAGMKNWGYDCNGID